uniref:Uncharacterized protein n=1 Tax=Avena sativa TaxID=4498 RepID=A0ACD5VTM9_AVESA
MASAGGGGTVATGDAGTAAAGRTGSASAAADNAGTTGTGGPGTEAAGGAATDGAQAAGTGVPAGMDPSSTYLLKICLIPNPKKARKEIKSFCFEKFIDSDLTNYKDLLEEIVEEYPPRYLEVAHFPYYDDLLKIYPEIHSDQELMSMFEKHFQKKVDYVTNNLAESFNNWIKHHKSLNLDDFLDKVRQLLMIMWNRRTNVAKKLDGLIMPHIIKKLKAMTRDLNLEVVQSSEEVAEVTTLGGSGFRFVVNLQERTCSCRQFQVSGLPCKHALAFITSLNNAHIQTYVDLYYSVAKFRAAYAQLIPAMPDKTQWPESDHGFFMHPPLLKSTTDDIAAMLTLREPPKKKIKAMKGNESAIVPSMDEAPTRMSFPPSQSLKTSSCKKGKGRNTGSKGSKRSRAASSQLEPISLELPMPNNKREVDVPAKVRAKKKNKEVVVPAVPLDSPAMGTRSKKFNPSSPAMSTRSKRRLSL